MHPAEPVELVVADDRLHGVDVAHAPRLVAHIDRRFIWRTAPTRFPLPLRNALAELAIAGLDDPAAAAALAWLAAPGAPPPPDAGARLAAGHLIETGGATLLSVHAPWAADVAAHAGRALAARAAYTAAPASAPAADVAGAVVRAAALWDTGLFFEVHEVLEAVWKRTQGDVRQALQGLIQVAVAFHHLAHANLRGAQSLLVEGRARLASVPATTLPVIDVPHLLAATDGMAEALAVRDATAAGRATGAAPPRLPRRECG
jgi:hypothetical protein